MGSKSTINFDSILKVHGHYPKIKKEKKMSGCSYDSPCPNCSGNMRCYSDHKPHDYVTGDCPDCGFYFFTDSGYKNLKELNEIRAEMHEQEGPFDPDDETDGYPPLKKLPKQKFDKS